MTDAPTRKPAPTPGRSARRFPTRAPGLPRAAARSLPAAARSFPRAAARSLPRAAARCALRAAAVSAGLAAGLTAAFGPAAALAADLTIVAGPVGRDNEFLRSQLDIFEQETGHTVSLVEMPSSTSEQFGQYRLWLSAGNSDVDIYRADIVWAPQLAPHFLDLTEAMGDDLQNFNQAIVDSQTVDGRLVAAPWYTDAPALYYRADLLEKYGLEVPATWAELETAARTIQQGEREAGAADFHGYVWQGAAYEGLTCTALEWVASMGGGHVVEDDGEITVNNPQAAAAIEMAAAWVGDISPEGVLGYKEEEARGVWQTGKAAFMRNWPYAYALSQGEDSAVAGKFDVAPLPSGEAGAAATLGGWNLAVSKYSEHADAAVDLVKFLISPEVMKRRAIEISRMPTRPALYDDPELREAQPAMAKWQGILAEAVARPSAPTKTDYNEVSKEFWDAVHASLSGQRPAEASLKRLNGRLMRLRGAGW